jgi:hypothetical protein
VIIVDVGVWVESEALVVSVSGGVRRVGWLADREGRGSVWDLAAVAACVAAAVPAGGDEGLADRSRLPRTSPNRIAADVEALASLSYRLWLILVSRRASMRIAS